MPKSRKVKGNKRRNGFPGMRTFIVGIIFLIVGIYLVWYSLSLPCNIDSLTQNVNSELLGEDFGGEIEFPKEFQRIICLTTDFEAIVSMLIGSMAIIVSVPGIFKGLTQQHKH